MAKEKTTESTDNFLVFSLDYAERLIESPAETKGGRWVRWGDKNSYPQYINDLCKNTPTLRTVILGLVDYVCGNDVTATHGLSGRGMAFDTKGTKIRELIKGTAMQIAKFGGFAWKMTNNADGSLGEIEVLRMDYIRMNEECTRFFYSEKWVNGYARHTVEYDAWVPGTKLSESVFFLKLWGEDIYPEPIFSASVKAAETERSIDSYHLGNIERGFMGSYLVNFNGGNTPTREEKREVERKFTEKFAGHRNAGRVMFSWNRNKDSQTTLQKMEVSDYGEKYETLAKHCEKQIFTAFRANPNLFGVATESNGFNSEEYEQAFKLFNRTMVMPIQQQIIDALERVMGEKGVITIIPFSLDGVQTEVQ